MPFANDEIALRKWMMDKDTLGYSGWRGSQDLGELASGDYLTTRHFLFAIKKRKVNAFQIMCLFYFILLQLIYTKINLILIMCILYNLLFNEFSKQYFQRRI